MIYKVALFAVITGALAYVSRDSLRRHSYHGFYRFFAWEFIIVLVLYNLGYWFRHPFSLQQTISWSLLIVSLFLVIHSIQLLHSRGKPNLQRNDQAPAIGFEKTTVLVTTGIYKYIRHPLYASLLFLAWGVFSKAPSWPGVILALAASIFLLATAKTEEAENLRFFGPAYQDYIKRTRMFIPFLF
jgi:protein-S-isoprenylcysteine O-methyltransferase Ste14